MRILFLSTFCPPHFEGGAEISSGLLADALLERGHDLKLFIGVPKEGDSPNHIKSIEDGWPMHAYDIPFRGKIANSLKRKIEAYNPDIIHAHDYRAIMILNTLLKKELRIPAIVTIRDYWPICLNDTLSKGDDFDCKEICRPCFACFSRGPTFNPARLSWEFFRYLLHMTYTRFARKKVLNSFDGIIFTSQYLKNKIMSNLNNVKLKIDPIVIRNIVKMNFKSEDNKLMEKKNILYAGGLVEKKGYDLILKAFRKMNHLNIQIVGKGTDKIWKSLKKEYKLKDNFEFLGKVPYERMTDLYRKSLLVVSSSLWNEPFSRVLHEAMLHGCPVVATNVGGQTEALKRSDGGVLVKKLSESIKKSVLRLSTDEILYKNKAQSGKKYVVRELNPLKIADKHIEYYKKCLT